MDFKNFPINRHDLLALVILLVSLCWLTTISAAETTASQIRDLETRFRAISTEIYRDFVRQKKFGNRRFKDVTELEQEVLSLVSQDKSIHAIYLIRNHMNLIEENIDNRAIFYLVDLLLRHNEWNTANTILKNVSSEGDKSLLSNVTFIFAKYYANRKLWAETLHNLEGVISDLPAEDAHYALLLQGISEQSRKNHRQAVRYYSKVPVSSKYYPLAVLNTAVAYIRQGWWTDAKIIIDKLLDDTKAKVNDETINRLYLITGYSLLQQGYFRNSREAFRNITLDSKYTNRALLGIALSATNQEDFIGALNAINILKQKKSHDLPVDESHLLLPYIYEKLKQSMTATRGYTEALGYYQKRVQEVKKLIETKIQTSLDIKISADKTKLLVGNTELDFTSHYPKSFLQNHTELEVLNNHIDNVNKKTHQKFKKLYAEHTTLLKKLSKNLLNERINFLNSYMSQSRFGLARLYDNSATPGKAMPVKAAPVKTTPGNANPGDAAAPNNSTPDNATPDNATPGNATPGNATPDNATPGNATPGNATPANATPDNATPGNATPDNATPDNATPDNATPDNATPDNATPDNATPGNAIPGNATPG